MSNPHFAFQMAQMANYGKELVKPKELYGLWTLGDGIYTDKSIYNGSSVVPSTTSIASTIYPFLECLHNTTISFVLGRGINLGKDWTLEYTRICPPGRPYSYITLGKLKFQNDSYDDFDSRVYLNNTQINAFSGWRGTANSIMHNAITYNSATHTLTMFANETVLSTCVQDLTNMSATTIVLYCGGVGYGSSEDHYFFSNVRVVQKLLTPTTPSTLYTGYEVL